MLMDVLATVVAFASVMLLFSLFVTATVQAIHATFQLRYHNLRLGMTSFFDEMKRDAHLADDATKEKIKQALNSLIVVRKPKSIIPVQVRPESVDVDEVKHNIRKCVAAEIGEDQIEALEESVLDHFHRAEAYMVQRFQRISHGLSILVALGIAAIYQINAPALLKELSTDPEMREVYICYAEEQFKAEKEELPLVTYREAVISAATRMRVLVPDQAEQFAELAEAKISRSEELDTHWDRIMGAVTVEMINHRELRLIKSQFDGLLKEKLAEERQKKLQQWEEQANNISLLQLSVFPHGKGFYLDLDQGFKVLLGNYFGVFISGILISLGAPFWFNNLKMLFSIREKIKHHV